MTSTSNSRVEVFMQQTGLESLFSRTHSFHKSWERCGLLFNQASVTRDFVSSVDSLSEILGERLVALFGPQHGFSGTVQDNMMETPHVKHDRLGIPIYSLYSETREPTAKMLEGLETLIIDLQNVGCRVYTFKWTLAACLRAGKRYGKKIVVLDRPNPIGCDVIEGRQVDADRFSFVGESSIPMRHGLTMGEFANMLNQTIKADLEVIPCEYPDPTALWGELSRPWVLTSPNLPTLDPVYLYPGMVIFEGTNISEGRGTTLPFQWIGAPYIKDAQALKNRTLELLGREAPGVYLRPGSFMPTFHKWKHEECRGVQLHVTEPRKVRSYELALCLLKAFMDFGGNAFHWKNPPYEYNHKDTPIELILGSKDVASHLENFSINDPFWFEGQTDHIQRMESAMLYPRSLGPTRGMRPSTLTQRIKYGD